jgi:hypothetical protein
MDRPARYHVDRVMLALLIAAAANPPEVTAAADLCRPILARKAGGEIATIDVTSFTVRRKDVAIAGLVTALVGMRPPAPGYASAHHLVRSQFSYKCKVARAKVRSASVAPLQ